MKLTDIKNALSTYCDLGAIQTDRNVAYKRLLDALPHLIAIAEAAGSFTKAREQEERSKTEDSDCFEMAMALVIGTEERLNDAVIELEKA